MALKQHLLLALKKWTVNPVALKTVNPLSFSCRKFENWIVQNFPYKLCKPYLQQIGYTQIVDKLFTMIFSWVFDLEVDLRPMLTSGSNVSLCSNS